MRIAVYFNGDSIKEYALAQALVEGFDNLGDEAFAIELDTYDKPLDGAQMGVVLGLLRGKIFREYQRAGRHAVLITPGYIRPDTHHRFALDAFHSSWSNPDLARAELLVEQAGFKFAPARTAKDFKACTGICYSGISKPYAGWLSLEPARTFDLTCITRVLKTLPADYRALFWSTDEMVPEVVRLPRRCHPIFRVPLRTILEYSSCLITHGQPELVAGILTGTPVIDMAEEDLRPIPGLPFDEKQVKATRVMSDEARWKALADVASREFSLDEIRSGAAMHQLSSHTVKRLEGSKLDPNSREYLAEQYKLMHENPRLFRGGLHESVLLEMSGLVSAFAPKTLLDYGSGKGRQYTAHRQHRKWGGPEPVCYDPGYEPYMEKPAYQFDGVLCTDVAEHIPESGINDFLKEVLWYGKHFALLRIATWPARKNIPDGRNAHLTIQPPDWWVLRVTAVLETTKGPGETLIVKKHHDNKWTIHYGRKSVVLLFEEPETP